MTNITVEAVFERKAASLYTATVVPSENGEGAINHQTENDYELNATPNADYSFDHWEYRISTDETTWGEWGKYTDLNESHGLVTVDAHTQFRAVFSQARFVLYDDCRLYWTSAVDNTHLLIPGDMIGIGGIKHIVYNDLLFWDDMGESASPAVPGEPCYFEFQWDLTGPVRVDHRQPNDDRLKVRIRLYSGTDISEDPVFDTGTISIRSGNSEIIYPHGSCAILNFIMPKAEYLTLVFEVEGFDPVQKTYSTGLNFALDEALNELGTELNTLDNLRYRYFIDQVLAEASKSASAGMTEEDIRDLVADARAEIEAYVSGSNDDYIEVSFNNTLVYTDTGISQSQAFMAAMEQVYPREKGFWYFDCAGTQFGLWVNGFGGRAFTDSELGPDGIAHTEDDGVLETAIITPSKTFAAGEPLPESGLVMGSQVGSLQYYVNGKYADYGVTGWNVSDNEIYTWGPSDAYALYKPLYSLDHIANTSSGYMLGDKSDETALLWAVAYLHRIGVTKNEILSEIGMTDTSELTAAELYAMLLDAYPQYAVRLSRDTATDMDKIPSVVAAYEAINAIEGTTGEDRLAAVIAARNAYDDINLNGQYGLKRGFLQGYFGNQEPYKTAYQKLVAAEQELGIEPPEQATPAEALVGVMDYLTTHVTNPVVGSDNGDWAVLALARGGVISETVRNAYLANLDAAISGNRLTNYTDYERVTLALSALGIDASKYGAAHTDLTAVYKTYVSDPNRTVNADIFALLALNAKPYTGDQDAYVAAVCDAAMNGGGWSLYEDSADADVDVTAMAIQALAPYYAKDSIVKAKVDAAITWLHAKQDSYTGGFLSYAGNVSTCSTAQVVVALCAMGIDPNGADWTVDGMTPLTALTLWYREDGSFGETDAAGTNQMSTEQAAYALVSWKRFSEERNALYDMRDMFPDVASDDASVNRLSVKGKAATVGSNGVFTVELPYGTDLATLTSEDITITAADGATWTDPVTADGGETWIFTVTAEDGTTTAEYTVTVTVAETPDVSVVSLSLNIEGATVAPEDENHNFAVVLPYGTEPSSLTKDSFTITLAEGATRSELDTQNGGETWSFTVTAKDGTTQQTYTISVTVSTDNAEQNQADVDAVLAQIPATMTTSYRTVTNAPQANAFVLKELGNLNLDSTVSRSVEITKCTASIDGTAENPAGTDGSFTAKVTLSKGEGATLAMAEVIISGTIKAHAYVDPNATITVKFRLIGANPATQFVDLSKSDYMPDYVTWIPTTDYTIPLDYTMYDLFTMAMTAAELTSIGADSGYVKTINAPESLGGYALSEFTNGKRSGWMYTVNGHHPGVGLTDYTFASDTYVAEAGTQPIMVVWHYVNDYAYEVDDWHTGSQGNDSIWNKWLDAPDVAPAVPVDSVALDKETASVAIGKTVTLTATVSPENATDKTVTWTSSDETVAIVVDGVVTGVAEGNAIITATAGGKIATCELTVTEAPEPLDEVPEDKISVTGEDTGNPVANVTSEIEANGTATLHVTAEKPCVVVVKIGETYQRLEATPNAEGGYDFSQEEYNEAMEFIVAVKGDADGNGEVTTDDAMQLARACLSESHRAYLAASDLNQAVYGTINTDLAMLIARACLSTEHRAYLALDW